MNGKTPDRLRRRGQRRRVEVGQTAARPSSRCSTSSRCSRSARSRSIRRTRRSSGSAPARRGRATGLDRRRHLQVDRRRRDLDQHGPAELRAHRARSSSIRANGNTVYACVPGKLWSDCDDRGVYKTTDGGKTWTQVLKGANLLDRLLDADDGPEESRRAASPACGTSAARAGRSAPAATARRAERQRPVQVDRRRQDLDASSTTTSARACRRSRGAASRSRSRRRTPKRRLRVHRVDATRALYRSDDGGKTWEQRDSSQMMVWRPFYFAQPRSSIRRTRTASSSPTSASSSATTAARASPTSAAARTATATTSGSIRSNPKHVIAGDDGGLWYLATTAATAGGRPNNLPVSQFYHVSVDNDGPVPRLRRPAGQQLVGRRLGVSRAASPTRAGRTCTAATASGCSPIRPIPTYVYAEAQGGYIGRVNRSTHDVARHPAEGATTRRSCASTGTRRSHVSPTQKGTLYIGAQFLFRSRDHGQTLGAHLARPDHQRPGEAEAGAVGRRHRRQLRRPRCTRRSTRSASRRRTPNVIWVGTDDGNVQLTRDGGKTLDERGRQHARAAEERRGCRWVEAEPLRRRHRVRDVRPPHLRRHDAVRRTRPPTSARPGRGSSRPAQRRARLRARDQGRSRSSRTSSSSAPSSACGSRSTAASTGRSSRAATSRRSRCATSPIHPRDDDLVHRHARPRHLDHRRHHAAARARRRDCWQKDAAFLPSRAGAAAHAGARRLGRRRRDVRRARTRPAAR